MSRFTTWLFAAALLLLGAHLALASTVAVGTCRPKLPSYSSISAAVAGVPPGTTIDVCPNSYYEQVFITQPLNLVGVANGNTTDIVIYPPASGLSTVANIYGETIAPQVAVSAGPVNISNITVDGTGNNVSCIGSFVYLVGIFYGDGSSGTVNEITARNLTTGSCFSGAGAWAESTGGKSVTVENSSFHNIDQYSVVGEGNLVATFKGNYMAASGDNVWWGSPGSLTGNDIEGGVWGIILESPGTISSNTIANQFLSGIDSFYGFGGGAVVTSNKISNSPTGINVIESGDTFNANTITNTGTAMEFNCNTQTVAKNTVNDATTGFDRVPAGFSGVNKFYSVSTIRTGGCPLGPTKPSPDLPGKPGMPLPAPSR